jgi:ABC-2 type transport system ATP-binding protein
MGLAEELRGMPGAEMVAPFGAALHVSGTDRALLERSLAPVAKRAGVKLREVPPSLEDVFIHLMRDLNEPARPRRGEAH